MILLRIALRNIFATKIRTLIIGLLIVFGTALVVLGGALLSTLEMTMARSIIGSVSGHFQIYSRDARDKLELFAPPIGTPRLGEIKDFPAVKAALQQVPGVKEVVPMGNDFAMVFSGNIMDIKLAELRAALDAGDDRRVQVLLRHLRRNVGLLSAQVSNLEGFLATDSRSYEVGKNLENLAIASAPDFWATFEQNREERITFLENKIAKLAMDERMLFLSYIGTDTEAFARDFELFEIVKGEKIPPGQRGFLFSDFMYERAVKHQVAARFDRIREKLETGLTIRDDKRTANLVDQNVRQYKDILLQLDEDFAPGVFDGLRSFLGTHEQDPVALLKSFLQVDDDNFKARYEFFYERIAPHIVLYQTRIGDVLNIQSYTRRGYPTSVNVKVYGTYRSRGLEKSALAGAYSLMDIMTFRDLYGHATDEDRREAEQLRQKAQVLDVDRAQAEDALFAGDDAPAVERAAAGGFDEFAGLEMKDGGRETAQDLAKRVYTQQQIDSGVTTNAAIVLEPAFALDDAQPAIEAVLAAAAPDLKLVDWKSAAGLIGQLIDVVWIVLVTGIFIIFLVALVIINNSMVMATLDRTREIGTMRAIGAQRSYVLRMFLIESTVLGIGFGIIGVLLGSGLVLLLGHVGIPAVSDELFFLFSGPRLHPVLQPVHLAVAFTVVFVVSVASTLYPARLATRILPVKAMGKED